MEAPDLSVLIVNWNAASLLHPCLESIAQQRADLRLEVLVVDNASTDESLGMLRQNHSWVRRIENSENHGFAAAVNQAAALSSGRYLLLLNPDTFTYPSSLVSLVRHMDSEPGLGAVGPRLLNADGTPQRSAWRLFPGFRAAFSDAAYLWKARWLPGYFTGEYSPAELQNTRLVGHILGASMLIRREAWEQVGPLDEAFFLFLEETDWCLRATRAGWKIGYNPNVLVLHYGQQSTRQLPAPSLNHFYRGYCLFLRKHYGFAGLKVFLIKVIFALACSVRAALWSLRSLWAGRQTQQKVLAQHMRAGYLSVLAELPGY